MLSKKLDDHFVKLDVVYLTKSQLVLSLYALMSDISMYVFCLSCIVCVLEIVFYALKTIILYYIQRNFVLKIGFKDIIEIIDYFICLSLLMILFNH